MRKIYLVFPLIIFCLLCGSCNKIEDLVFPDDGSDYKVYDEGKLELPFNASYQMLTGEASLIINIDYPRISVNSYSGKMVEPPTIAYLGPVQSVESIDCRKYNSKGLVYDTSRQIEDRGGYIIKLDLYDSHYLIPIRISVDNTTNKLTLEYILHKY